MKILFKNINKKFDSQEIYKDANLEISDSFYIISGENGSGKSTLFNILYRAEDYEGEIYYNETNILHIDIDAYRTNIIRYVKQEDEVFPFLSFKENLNILVKDFDQEKLEFLLENFNMQEVYNSKKKYKKLSGGEKQKSRIIISLLTDFEVLLLDEPENNLDNESIKFLIKYLKELNKCIIVSSHTLDEFIDVEDFNSIEIIDKKLYVNEKLEIISKEQKDLNLKKKKYLSKKDYKKIAKSNKAKRLAVSFIIILAMAMFLIVGAKFTFSLEYLWGETNQDSYGANSLVINAPIVNDMYAPFGDENWIEKTPYLFTTEDYKKLEKDDRVKEVIPLPISNNSTSNATIKDKYIAGPTIFLKDLNYKKYNLDKYKTNKKYGSVDFHEVTVPKEISKNTPFSDQQGINISDILFGAYPKDESDEIMIDPYYAMYFAQEMNYDSVKDLIGKEIKVPVKQIGDYDEISMFKAIPQKEEYFKYKVSGIYESGYNKEPSEDIMTNVIYYSYHKSERLVRKNSKWLDYYNRDKELNTRDNIFKSQIMGAYEVHNLELKNIDEVMKTNPIYPSFYIETKSSEDADALSKELLEYDQYVQVKSNYTKKHSTNYRYLKGYVNKVLIQYLFVLIITIMIIFIVIKFYYQEIINNISKLKFHGFSYNIVKAYLKKENKMLYTQIIFIAFLLEIYVFLSLISSQEYILAIILNIQLIILLIIIRIILAFQKYLNSKKGE